MILILSGSCCIAQSGNKVDTTKTYCMPMADAVMVFEDAVKKYYQDTVIHQMGVQIQLEKDNSASQHESFTRQIAVEKEKTRIANERTINQQAISGNYKQESEAYQKQSKRHRNERNGVIFIWILTVTGFVLL